MKLFSVFLILIFLLPSFPAMAGTADWSNVSKLKQNTDIVVKKANGETVEGQFGVVVDDELSVIGESQQVTKLKRDEIREIRKQKSHSGNPVLIGLAAGAGGGYIIGRVSESEADRSEDPGLIPLFTTLIGAGVGALAGVVQSRKAGKLIYQPE